MPLARFRDSTADSIPLRFKRLICIQYKIYSVVYIIVCAPLLFIVVDFFFLDFRSHILYRVLSRRVNEIIIISNSYVRIYVISPVYTRHGGDDALRYSNSFVKIILLLLGYVPHMYHDDNQKT